MSFPCPSRVALVAIAAAGACAAVATQAGPARHATMPAVSPDGRQIAFLSDRDGRTELYAVDAEGLEVRRLTTTDADESRPSWTADGAAILVARMDGDRSTLSALPVPAGPERVVARVAGRSPQPIGSARVLFATGDWSAMQLATAALDGSDVKPLSDGRGAIWNAALSPDGSRIAFTRQADGALQVWTMAADGSDVRAVGPFEGRAQMPAWAPDGRRLAVQVNSGAQGARQARIWVVDLASGERRALDGDGGGPPRLDEVPSWFPDGHRIAFQSDRTGAFEIWVADLTGGPARQLTR